jgi:hypothetical protein
MLQPMSSPCDAVTGVSSVEPYQRSTTVQMPRQVTEQRRTAGVLTATPPVFPACEDVCRKRPRLHSADRDREIFQGDGESSSD